MLGQKSIGGGVPNDPPPAWLGFKLVKIVKVDIFFQAQIECVVNINNCNNRLIFLSLVFHLHYTAAANKLKFMHVAII